MLDKNVVEKAIVMFQYRWAGKCDPTDPANDEQDQVVQQTFEDLVSYLDCIPDGTPLDMEDIDEKGVFLLYEYLNEDLKEPLVRFEQDLLNAVSD